MARGLHRALGMVCGGPTGGQQKTQGRSTAEPQARRQRGATNKPCTYGTSWRRRRRHHRSRTLKRGVSTPHRRVARDTHPWRPRSTAHNEHKSCDLGGGCRPYWTGVALAGRWRGGGVVDSVSQAWSSWTITSLKGSVDVEEPGEQTSGMSTPAATAGRRSDAGETLAGAAAQDLRKERPT